MKYWQSLRTRLVMAALLCLVMGALPLLRAGREGGRCRCEQVQQHEGRKSGAGTPHQRAMVAMTSAAARPTSTTRVTMRRVR